MIRDALTVNDALERLGFDVDTLSSSSVAGGCISNGTRIAGKGEQAVFVKRSSSQPSGMFPAEAAGLLAMHKTNTLRVPEPLAVNTPETTGEKFIIMEWIESGQKSRGFADALGTGLARMHREGRGPRFGFDTDNFIGATPQENPWSDDWLTFFAEHRLRFQARLAQDSGKLDERTVSDIDSICENLGNLLPDTDHPSLLHGDLWGGNYVIDSAGNPVLIDPATYYGHREADLAMTKLFGGFPQRFYSAYNEEWPLEPGFNGRSDLYNLYHMLNHLNLFGSGYRGSVTSIVRQYR